MVKDCLVLACPLDENDDGDGTECDVSSVNPLMFCEAVILSRLANEEGADGWSKNELPLEAICGVVEYFDANPLLVFGVCAVAGGVP